MCCEKKSEAGAAQAARRLPDRVVPRERRAGLLSVSAVPLGVVPEAQTARARCTLEGAHARDRQQPGALRLLAHFRAAAPRRLAG